MAKASEVVSDMNSEEVDQLRRAFHSLLLVLENISSQVNAATITATEGWEALYATVSGGSDDDITAIGGGANNYAGTGLVVAGVKPTPTHPKQPRSGQVTDLTVDSKF